MCICQQNYQVSKKKKYLHGSTSRIQEYTYLAFYFFRFSNKEHFHFYLCEPDATRPLKTIQILFQLFNDNCIE